MEALDELGNAQLSRAVEAGNELLARPRAIFARYDDESGRLIVTLTHGLEITVNPDVVQGLAQAEPAALSDIKIERDGLALHFPKLDADIWIPGLLAGQLGSRAWMARITQDVTPEPARSPQPAPRSPRPVR